MRKFRRALVRNDDQPIIYRNIYAAGLFDTAGRLSIDYRVSKDGAVYHWLRLTIRCCSSAQAKWLMEKFDRGFVSGKNWIANGPQAREVLIVIVEDCVFKKRSAMLAIAYQNSVDNNRDFMRQSYDKVYSKNLSIEELEKREEFRERMIKITTEENH